MTDPGWTALPPTPPLQPVAAPPTIRPESPVALPVAAPGRSGGFRQAAIASVVGAVVALTLVVGPQLELHGARPTVGAAPVADPAPTGAMVPSVPSAAAGATLSAEDVAAAVRESIVDVNTSLGWFRAGAGTGMIISSSGMILTNNHVIEGARSISVRLVSTGRSYPATVVGTDPDHDVAVIQIKGVSGLRPIPLGDSSTVSPGDWVVAIGNAGGDGGEPTVVTGRVTGLNRTITVTEDDGTNPQTLSGMIATNAPLQQGQSGGPLLNSSGQVIGVDTAASSGRRFRSFSGTEGLAIPINQALAIARRLGAA